MKKILLIQSLLLIPVVFVFWIVAYPETLQWMEEYSFFSTLPDFTHLQVRLPGDALRYVGAFVLQFYRWTWVAAALQTLFAWAVMALASYTLWRVLRIEKLMWAAYIPTAIFVSRQCLYRDLEWSFVWVIVMALVAIAARLFVRRPVLAKYSDDYQANTSQKRGKNEVKPKRSRFAMALIYVILPIVLLGAGFYVSLNDMDCAFRERIHKVEHLAEEQKWEEILEFVTPEVALNDGALKRYAILALLETDMLANRAFEYGVTTPDDFYFMDRDEFVGIYYNSLLYKSMGVDDEVIHLMYLLNEHSRLGFSFRSLRTMADAYLRIGNALLAEKYLTILSHTTCHGAWLKPRWEQLAALKANPVPRPTEPSDVAVGAHGLQGQVQLLNESLRLLEAFPTNKKIVDVLLCGLLAICDVENFGKYFDKYAPQAYAGHKMPLYYEEALILYSYIDRTIYERFPVRQARLNDFQRFSQYMNSGQKSMARQSAPRSFWAYMYCSTPY